MYSRIRPSPSRSGSISHTNRNGKFSMMISAGRMFRGLTFGISRARLFAPRLHAAVSRSTRHCGLNSSRDIVTMFVHHVEVRCEDHVLEKLCRLGLQFSKLLFM